MIAEIPAAPSRIVTAVWKWRRRVESPRIRKISRAIFLPESVVHRASRNRERDLWRKKWERARRKMRYVRSCCFALSDARNSIKRFLRRTYCNGFQSGSWRSLYDTAGSLAVLTILSQYGPWKITLKKYLLRTSLETVETHSVVRCDESSTFFARTIRYVQKFFKDLFARQLSSVPVPLSMHAAASLRISNDSALKIKTSLV